ncbi:SseB family protein [Nocardia sp. BMG51109]|uniref:SseB family protein n=1 Tax=Nocardia sp. BMG51109 TaxID=1056816 RepID=UPI000466110B|nr:SseB family protein [Nocardia sp. BMG51109]
MSYNDGRDALRGEIVAFYAGFGQREALLAALRAAALLVPVSDDDRVQVSQVGGIDWLCAFTSVEEYARYTAARGRMTDGGIEPDRRYSYHSLWGWRLLAYAESRDRPTGVAVDVVGAAPMAFPPNVSE